MRTFPNTFPSSHFLFIKCANCYSDKDLLAKLGVSVIEYISTWPGDSWLGIDGIMVKSIRDLNHTAYLTDDGQWLHVMDNMYFDLFHNPRFRAKLSEFGTDYEVLYGLAGDTDDSIELIHWKGGRKVRHLTGDMRFLTFEENDGKRFNCETSFTSDKVKKLNWPSVSLLLTVAKEIGINIDHTQGKLRAYEIQASLSD